MCDAPFQSDKSLKVLAGALKLNQARVISVCGAGGKTTLIFSLAREFAAAGEKVLITTTTKMALDECQGQFRVVQAAGAGQILKFADSASFGPDAVIAHFGESGTGEKLIGFSPDVIDAVSRDGPFDRILVEADGSRRKPLKAPSGREPVFPKSSDAVVMVAGLNGIGRVLCEENLFRADIWAGLTGLKTGEIITPGSVARAIAHPDGMARGCPGGAIRVAFLNRADKPQNARHARAIMDVLPGLSDSCPVHVAAGWLLPDPVIVA